MKLGRPRRTIVAATVVKRWDTNYEQSVMVLVVYKDLTQDTIMVTGER